MCTFPGGGGGGGRAPPPPPPKIGKKYDFFGVRSWFFTRNTPKIFAPPCARRIFLKCAPPNLKSWIRPCFLLTLWLVGNYLLIVFYAFSINWYSIRIFFFFHYHSCNFLDCMLNIILYPELSFLLRYTTSLSTLILQDFCKI